MKLETATTAELSAERLARLRRFLVDAFDGDFGDEDFRHALGGRHLWLEDDAGLVAHASVVSRVLVVGGRALLAGYVEAVATRRDRRRIGCGSRIMRAVAGQIHARYEIGALSSNADAFYERLGWEKWRGLTGVMEDASALAGPFRRTPDDDGGVMVLRTGAMPSLDLDQSIVCDPRAGDPW